MGISWPCILGKECFDMLKSIGFGDLVRLFSSSRWSDRVYLRRTDVLRADVLRADVENGRQNSESNTTHQIKM